MRRILAALLGMILLGGCTLGELLADYGEPVTLTPEQLVGVWARDKHTLDFTADGRFAADNLPADAFQKTPSGSPDPAPMSGEGTWKIDGPKVDLTFTEVGGKPAGSTHQLSCVLQEDVVYLVFFHVGSGGTRWTAYQR